MKENLIHLWFLYLNYKKNYLIDCHFMHIGKINNEIDEKTKELSKC